jgi:hypothetical protein
VWPKPSPNCVTPPQVILGSWQISDNCDVPQTMLKSSRINMLTLKWKKAGRY